MNLQIFVPRREVLLVVRWRLVALLAIGFVFAWSTGEVLVLLISMLGCRFVYDAGAWEVVARKFELASRALSYTQELSPEDRIIEQTRMRMLAEWNRPGAVEADDPEVDEPWR